MAAMAVWQLWQFESRKKTLFGTVVWQDIYRERGRERRREDASRQQNRTKIVLYAKLLLIKTQLGTGSVSLGMNRESRARLLLRVCRASHQRHQRVWRGLHDLGTLNGPLSSADTDAAAKKQPRGCGILRLSRLLRLFQPITTNNPSPSRVYTILYYAEAQINRWGDCYSVLSRARSQCTGASRGTKAEQQRVAIPFQNALELVGGLTVQQVVCESGGPFLGTFWAFW